MHATEIGRKCRFSSRVDTCLLGAARRLGLLHKKRRSLRILSILSRSSTQSVDREKRSTSRCRWMALIARALSNRPSKLCRLCAGSYLSGKLSDRPPGSTTIRLLELSRMINEIVVGRRSEMRPARPGRVRLHRLKKYQALLELAISWTGCANDAVDDAAAGCRGCQARLLSAVPIYPAACARRERTSPHLCQGRARPVHFRQ